MKQGWLKLSDSDRQMKVYFDDPLDKVDPNVRFFKFYKDPDGKKEMFVNAEKVISMDFWEYTENNLM